eukprot:320662-Amphidinium_carterae.1
MHTTAFINALFKAWKSDSTIAAVAPGDAMPCQYPDTTSATAKGTPRSNTLCVKRKRVDDVGTNLRPGCSRAHADRAAPLLL